MRGGVGGAQGLLPAGAEKGKGVGVHEVGPQGESWGPWRKKKWSCPPILPALF